MSSSHQGRYVVIITKPGDDKLYGPVEQSFSLDVKPWETQLYWTHAGYKIDGLEWATRTVDDWKKLHPKWKFQIYRVHGRLLPIKINWKAWKEASAPTSNTLSGVRDKYYARNLKFKRKLLTGCLLKRGSK